MLRKWQEQSKKYASQQEAKSFEILRQFAAEFARCAVLCTLLLALSYPSVESIARRIIGLMRKRENGVKNPESVRKSLLHGFVALCHVLPYVLGSKSWKGLPR